jgi:predicted nuclease of predicted toxin-antitoxin system
MKILLDEMYTGMKDYLEAMGWDIETLNTAGIPGASDTEVMDYAKNNSLVIVTQDEKLADIAELKGVVCVHITRKMVAKLIDSQLRKKQNEAQ